MLDRQADLKGGLVHSASFSPDGTRVITGGFFGVRQWDCETGRIVPTTFRPLKHIGADIATLPAGRTGTAARRRRLKHIGADIATLPADLRPLGIGLDPANPATRMYSTSFSPDGTHVLTGGLNGPTTARVWNANAGDEVLALQGHTGPVHAATFSRDGSRVVTGSGDRTARVWDAKTGEVLLTLAAHTDAINAVSFSPDGARILTASADRTVRVWDAKTGVSLLILEGHRGPVHAAAFNPRGTRIVTGSGDGIARVWDAAGGVQLVALQGHRGPVRAASFSPDGARILTGGDDGTVRAWDMSPPKR